MLALVLGFAGGGGGELAETLWVVLKAFLLLTFSIAASRFLTRRSTGCCAGFRASSSCSSGALVVGMAAIAEELGLSEAIGALMAGIVLAETSSSRDRGAVPLLPGPLRGAVLRLRADIDVGALDTVCWMVVLAMVLTLIGKLAAGYPAGSSAGSPAAGVSTSARRLSPTGRPRSSSPSSRPVTRHSARRSGPARRVCRPLRPATATIGIVLMKESKRVGRGFSRNLTPRLQGGADDDRAPPNPSAGCRGQVRVHARSMAVVSAVILHNDGMREIYFFRSGGDEDPCAVITLDDEEARQLGAVLGGVYDRPKIVEELEMALGELAIEWIPVPDDSPAIGRTLADCAFRARTGITIIAILREPEPVAGAQPTDIVERRHAGHGREARAVPGLPEPARRGPVWAGRRSRITARS